MFGSKLKQLREDAKLPQRKLAALLDIDTSTYSKIENGLFALRTLIPQHFDLTLFISS